MQFSNAAEIYLDNNATTKVLPEVLEALTLALTESYGNPSSAHSAGDRSREIIKAARESVATLISCESHNLIFTGSGTESNNMVLSSALGWCNKKPSIITTTVEHSSILAKCDQLESLDCNVIKIPVDCNGILKMKDLESALKNEVSLVSIQWVNNETGVIQPIEEISAMCRNAGIPFHTDAAQAVGKLPIKLSELSIDFLTLTGHKFHAPQGVGAVYARDTNRLSPLLYGGSQEGGLRPGTENLAGIAGLGSAASLRAKTFPEKVAQLNTLREMFESRLCASVPGIKINGRNAPRVCNTTNVQFEGIDGQALIARLDQEGIRCSHSSACTNQRPEPSYVLRAMGLSEDAAYGSIRFSFSELNSADEVETTIQKLATLCTQLRAFNS